MFFTVNKNIWFQQQTCYVMTELIMMLFKEWNENENEETTWKYQNKKGKITKLSNGNLVNIAMNEAISNQQIQLQVSNKQWAKKHLNLRI